MYQKKREEIEPCPLKYVFNLFGKKWNAWIYCSLVNNPSLRYTELKDILPDITDSALSAALKMFMKNDIIRRTSYDEIPPRVNIHLLIREDLLYLFYKDCVIGRHPIIQVILNIR